MKNQRSAFMRFDAFLASILIFTGWGFSQTPTPITIDFVNNANSDILLFFVNPQGTEHHFASIPAQKTLRQQSYPTQIWRLKSGGNVLGQYEATTDAKQELNIDATGRVSVGGTGVNAAGGFSEFRQLTPADLLIFNEVKTDTIWATYRPTEVSQGGMHDDVVTYRFRCIATEREDPASKGASVIVHITKNLRTNEKPERGDIVVDLKPVNYVPTKGGYSAFRDLTASDRAVWDEAWQDVEPVEGGTGYRPLKVATQVISGTNYLFRCSASNAAPPFLPWEESVRISKGLSGKAKIIR